MIAFASPSFSARSFLIILMKSSPNFCASFLTLQRRRFLQQPAICVSFQSSITPLLRRPCSSSLIFSGSFMKVSWSRTSVRGDTFLAFSTKSITREKTRFLKAFTFSFVGCESCFSLAKPTRSSSLPRIAKSSTQSPSSMLMPSILTPLILKQQKQLSRTAKGESPRNVLNAPPFYFQVIVELIGADLLLEDDDRLHEFIEGFMKLLSGVAQQILGQFEPDFQYWELLEYPRVDVAKLLLVADTLFEEGVNLFLVVFDVIYGQDLALSIPAEKSKVLVSFIDEMLVNFTHDGGAFAFLGQFNVAADLFNDFHEVDLFCGDDITNVGVDDGVLLEYLLILEIYRLLLLIFGILLDGLEAEVLPVVNYIVLLANDHSFAGLLLVDADFIVIEEVFFVLVDFAEIVGIGGSNVHHVAGVIHIFLWL